MTLHLLILKISWTILHQLVNLSKMDWMIKQSSCDEIA